MVRLNGGAIGNSFVAILTFYGYTARVGDVDSVVRQAKN